MTRLFVGCEYIHLDRRRLSRVVLVSLDGKHRFYAQLAPSSPPTVPFTPVSEQPPPPAVEVARATSELSKQLRAFLGQMREPLVLYVNEDDGRFLGELIHCPKAFLTAGPELTVRMDQVSDQDVLASTERWFKDRPAADESLTAAEAEAEALRSAAAALIR